MSVYRNLYGRFDFQGVLKVARRRTRSVSSQNMAHRIAWRGRRELDSKEGGNAGERKCAHGREKERRQASRRRSTRRRAPDNNASLFHDRAEERQSPA